MTNKPQTAFTGHNKQVVTCQVTGAGGLGKPWPNTSVVSYSMVTSTPTESRPIIGFVVWQITINIGAKLSFQLCKHRMTSYINFHVATHLSYTSYDNTVVVELITQFLLFNCDDGD